MNTFFTKILSLGIVLALWSWLPSSSIAQATCSPYEVDTIPHNPIVGSGDTVVLADDAVSVALPIGFNFLFYCQPYSQFKISSNGFITFDLLTNQHGCCSGRPIPNASNSLPKNIIAGAWDDLDPRQGGTISYFTTGTAPNRQLVVTFDSISHFADTMNKVSFQIVLHEGTNLIDIHSNNIQSNSSAILTQGIMNAAGTLGLATPGRNSTNWSSTGDSYRFENQNSIYGYVYQDFNQNCQLDGNDVGLAGRNLIIQPGNLIVQTNNGGTWYVDSLPVGTYTITVDTSGSWQPTCPITQTFTVVHPDSSLLGPAFGFISTNPCPSPTVSINAPFLRPGFSNQRIYVQACNEYLATNSLDSGYVIVELDSLFTVQNGSLPYTALGNGQYRVDVGTLSPGNCVHFWLSGTLSTTAVLGQSVCMKAVLLPIDSCVLDSIPTPYLSSTISPCNLPWDRSSLQVTGYCENDSVHFVISNTGQLGQGDMDCFAPVRVYVDGQYILLDSIQLVGGDSIVFSFAGNGQTWRLEADQHPLHPGNSRPNASVELCGDPNNWTPNLINILPHDDANPFVDIFCGVVRGSYDPNDKRGFPLGVGSSHDILPNQNLEYIIRFQNTGTDTAFTVVIRDTLATALDILSVQAGVSSHNYEFRMYGPRVLEWTFNNIMLPDSNVNEPASNGFVTFTVDQAPNLPNGTLIENSAGIYFDFNAPIITNTSTHTINDGMVILDITEPISQAMQLKVYPNPTDNVVTVELGSSQEFSITVLNQLGQVLHIQKANHNSSQVQLGHLPAGIYYLHIHDGQQTAVQKVIKQ